jgi:altered-inheritance-of-mitochondria protein 5
LSVRLVDTPTLVQAPLSAAARIKPHPFTSQLKSQWNNEMAALVFGIQNFDKKAWNWGRSLLYGPKKTTQASTSSS